MFAFVNTCSYTSISLCIPTCIIAWIAAAGGDLIGSASSSSWTVSVQEHTCIFPGKVPYNYIMDCICTGAHEYLLMCSWSACIRYFPWEGPIYSFKGLSLGRSLVHLHGCIVHIQPRCTCAFIFLI